MSLTLAKATPAQVSTPKSGYLALFLNSTDGDKLYAKDHLGNLSIVSGGITVDKVGNLLALSTVAKTDAVSAINETLVAGLSSVGTYTYVLDQGKGDDLTGSRGGKPFQSFDALIPNLSAGDVVLVKKGSYSISSNLMVDGVVWVFEAGGGSVFSSGNLFNDFGSPKTTVVIAPDWDLSSFGATAFITSDSHLTVRSRTFISTGNLALFHASPSASNFVDIETEIMSGLPYATSMRSFARGKIKAKTSISTTDWALFFRNDGATPFSGQYEIDCPAISNSNATSVVYSISCAASANVTIKGKIISGATGEGATISGMGTYNLFCDIETSVGRAIHVGGVAVELNIQGEYLTSNGVEAVITLDGTTGIVNIKEGTKITLSGGTATACLKIGTSVGTIYNIEGFRVETDVAADGISVEGADGKVIFGKGKITNLSGSPAASISSVLHPNIHLRGVVLTNMNSSFGVLPAFDLYSTLTGNSSIVVDASITE